jgi:Protein of unknown function (DUF732)
VDLPGIETMATMTLMAERVPPADDTSAPNGGETVAVPNSAPTDAVNVAWSRDDDRDDADDIQDDDNDIQSEPAAVRQSWRATWRIAAGLLIVGLVLAGAIVLGRWALTTHTKAAEPPPTALPTPKEGATPAPTAPATTSAPVAAPPSIASTQDQDNRYIQALNDRGITFANPDAAVYNGKLVCENVRQGMTVQQIGAAFRASNPTLSANADDYVAISIHAYCPQNGNLVGGGS